jgi:hypothetical protein
MNQCQLLQRQSAGIGAFCKSTQCAMLSAADGLPKLRRFRFDSVTTADSVKNADNRINLHTIRVATYKHFSFFNELVMCKMPFIHHCMLLLHFQQEAQLSQ